MTYMSRMCQICVFFHPFFCILLNRGAGIVSQLWSQVPLLQSEFNDSIYFFYFLDEKNSESLKLIVLDNESVVFCSAAFEVVS